MFLEHRPTPLRIRRYYANAHKRGQEVPSSSPCPALPRVLSVPTTSRGIGRCRVRVRPSRLHREHHGSSTPATSAATFSIDRISIRIALRLSLPLLSSSARVDLCVQVGREDRPSMQPSRRPVVFSSTVVHRQPRTFESSDFRGNASSISPSKKIECSPLIKAPIRTGTVNRGERAGGDRLTEGFSWKTSDRSRTSRTGVDLPWWRTIGTSVHSGRTIGVCARFSDPGSISRQIEFFLKIKENDLYL